jgi:dephospho-CoA kinase
MIESGGYKRFAKVIVVHCRPEVQLERLMRRNGFSREQAQQRIASQMSQDDKKKFADYLIDTSDGYEATRERTVAILRELIHIVGKN